MGFGSPPLSCARRKHKLVDAADQRSVLSDKLADLLPNLTSRLEDDNGKPFFYLGIIQSPYLFSERVKTNWSS